jgi:molybdopterin adenylyltransferase
MSSSTVKSLTAAVLTISDSCARGEREDLSGPAVEAGLAKNGFLIHSSSVIPDEQKKIEQAIVRLASEVQLIVTTGGTGIAERDVTPEATRAVCSKMLDGVAERMRAEGIKKTPLAALSRGVCGVCGRSLVLNLPGSPRGAVQSLEAVMDVIPHAFELLAGKTGH